nr:immunoglobulin heavy chain junction region [Macaca mulatta]
CVTDGYGSGLDYW